MSGCLRRTAFLYLLLALISFAIYDNVTSGALAITDATLRHRNEVPIAITLPYDAPTQVDDIVTLDFTYSPSLIDAGRALTVAKFGCLSEMTINDQRIAIAQAVPCVANNRIAVPQEMLESEHSLHVQAMFIYAPKTTSRLSLDRGLTFSLNNNIMYVGLLLYLLTVMLMRVKGYFRAFNYPVALTVLFVMSFAPFHDLATLKWWSSYMAQGMALAMICLLLLLWKHSYRALTYIGTQVRNLGACPTPMLVGALVVLFFCLTAFLSQDLFGGLPHVADTHTQMMQAKIFAQGKLFEPSHPLPRFFDFQFTVNDGKYYSIFFPGHSLMLAVGYLLGAEWLVNPFLGALTVLAVFALAYEVGGRSVALIAALLTCLSPFVVFMSSEYMSHTTCLLMLTVCLWAYIRLIKTRNCYFALLAGFCASYAFITRVQTTVPFTTPIVLHALWHFGLARTRSFKCLLALAIGTSPCLAFFFYNNYILTGSPWRTGYDIVTPRASYFWKRWGYWDAWENIINDYRRITSNTELRALHGSLLGWPTSSLWLVYLLFVNKAQRRFCGLLVACFLAQCLGNLFLNYYTSPIFAPRFYFETASVLIVLIALCLHRLPAILRALMPLRFSRAASYGSIVILVMMLTAIALPTRTADMYRLYGNNYWEGNAGYYHMLVENVEKPALIFMKNYHEYRFVYFTLPPHDENPVIFARDRGGENAKLMGYYPDRNAYLVEGNRISRLR